MHTTPLLLQHMLVFLGLTYLFTKTSTFKALLRNSLAFPQHLLIFLFFALFCVLGGYFSQPVESGAYANTRAIGAVVGGLLGGPVVGFLVGLSGGLARYWLFSTDPQTVLDLASSLATTLEGTFAGLVHYYLSKTRHLESLFNPLKAFLVALVAESAHMLVLLVMSDFSTEGKNLVRQIAFPMLIANSIGVSLIMFMLKDQKKAFERQNSSNKAWRIANQSVGIMTSGFNEDTSASIAHIIKNETDVGAVAITDTQKILAYTGIGDDSCKPGMEISSDDTLKAISTNTVIFREANLHTPDYQTALGSALVIPLRNAEQEVFGTITLYEPKHRLFLNINKQLGRDIANLLSNQILAGQFESQKNLLVQEELKRIQAQVNPHFLFNALNTIRAFTRTSPDKARELLLHLSNYFRKNLNRSGNMLVTLEEELEHIDSYLKIEKARYGDRLQVKVEIPESLLQIQLPVFTLQPLVENAIKHGISDMLTAGEISIYCKETPQGHELIVEDNAGTYEQKDTASLGIGLDLVNKRIKNLYGTESSLVITHKPQQWTRVSILLPTKL